MRAAPVALALIACAHAAVAPGLSYDGKPLVQLAPDVWVDPEANAEERAHLVADLRTGREQLAQKLGPLVTEPPLAIFCKTKACGLDFAGPSQRSWTFNKGSATPNGFIAPKTTVVVLRVDDGALGFAMHEQTHGELYARMQGALVPTWFHEGAAAFLSNAPDCAHPPYHGVDDLTRLSANAAWATYTDFRTAITPTYCQAKAEVAAWIEKNGLQRFVELTRSVHGGGAAFDATYGPLLTQPVAERRTPLMTVSTEIGDPRRAFSIALWIKPHSASGVLTGLTETPVGSGWCAPLLGFDAEHHLVAQLLRRGQPNLDSFVRAVSAEPVAPDAWSHVAMTWAPGGMQRLYLNGKLAAEVQSGPYFGHGAGYPMYLSWGSYNVAGPGLCWPGAIAAADFDGLIAGPKLSPRELTATELAELAKSPP
ncbi:MAG: hypothetical protein QM723_17480 [Myxococcaceae bacterium]